MARGPGAYVLSVFSQSRKPRSRRMECARVRQQCKRCRQSSASSSHRARPRLAPFHGARAGFFVTVRLQTQQTTPCAAVGVGLCRTRRAAHTSPVSPLCCGRCSDPWPPARVPHSSSEAVEGFREMLGCAESSKFVVVGGHVMCKAQKVGELRWLTSAGPCVRPSGSGVHGRSRADRRMLGHPRAVARRGRPGTACLPSR